MINKNKIIKAVVTLTSAVALFSTAAPTVAQPQTVQARYNYKDRYKIKMQTAKSHYKVPKIKKFTAKVQRKYKLMGWRWAKTKITYDIAKSFNQQEKTLIQNDIKIINSAKIVKLVKAKKKPKIKIVKNKMTDPLLTPDGMQIVKNPRDRKYIEGVTYPTPAPVYYKRLEQITKAKAIIYTDVIRLHHPTEQDYNNNFGATVIHELGHVLGLDHNDNSDSNIMNSSSSASDITNLQLDDDYISRLALLYQN